MSGFYAALGDASRDLAEQAARHAHGAMRVWDEPGVVLAAFDGRYGSGLAVADDLVVAMDGRLHEPRGGAQTLLERYRARRERALDDIAGDFAGAIFDRTARTLTIVRDACGGRSAILGRGPSRLVAASTIPMLLEDSSLDRTIDEGWVAAFVTAGAGFATATGYRSMRRLPTGSLARARDGAGDWTTARWHRWRVRAIREKDLKAYGDGLRERLVAAVRDRTDGAQSIGVSLSGGLDSTSVAAVLRLARPDARIVALAVPFTHPRGDERALQRMAAERIGAELVWAGLDGENPYGASPQDTLERLGVPPIAPNHFFVERVARAGREAGVEVALDGIDGDAIVAGNWYYLADLLVTGRWLRLRRELHAAAAMHGVGRKRIARDYLVGGLVPDRLRGEPAAPAHLDRGFVERAGVRRLLKGRTPWRPGRSYRANELAAMAPDVAPAILEQIGQAWGPVEVAHPFLDRRVVEYCLGLPRRVKVSEGLTKIVLRSAVGSLLPPEVAERSAKAELGTALFDGLKGPGSGQTQAGLTFAASNPLPWVDPEARDLLLDWHRDDPGRFDLFRVAFLGHWEKWLTGRLGRQEARGRPQSMGDEA